MADQAKLYINIAQEMLDRIECGKRRLISKSSCVFCDLLFLASGDLICDVKVVDGTLANTKLASFTYKASLSATITAVNPNRGGTGGGNILTITGTGFVYVF